MRLIFGKLFTIVPTNRLSIIQLRLQRPSFCTDNTVTAVIPRTRAHPVSTENNAAYQFLKTKASYDEMFFEPKLLSAFNMEGVEVFNRFSGYAKPGTDFSNLDFDSEEVGFIISRIQSLTDDQLKILLYQTTLPSQLPLPDAPNFERFWRRLDDECMSRASGWTYNELFTLCDLWYRNNLFRATKFHWFSVKKMFRKCDRLTGPEFIRFLFSLNLVRQIPESINTYELEHCLAKHIDSLTPTEAGIAAMALFKTKTPIRDFELFSKLVELVISEASTLQPIFISAVCKLGRLSGTGKTAALLYSLQEAFLGEIGRLNLVSVMHLAIICTRTLVVHDQVLYTVLRKVEEDVPNLRLKDMERLLLAFTMFNIDCEIFCQKVLQELRSAPSRALELKTYGRVVPSILFYLSMRGIYQYDLIDQVLDTNYLVEHFGKNTQKYQREIVCLDFAVGLDCPDYKGNRLSIKIRKSVSRVNLLWLWPETQERVSLYEHSVRTASTYLRNILGGKEYVYTGNILPHFHSAELVFFLDKTNKPIKVPKAFQTIPAHDVKYIPHHLLPPDTVAHATLICGYNSLVRNRPRTLLGQARLQQEQLAKLGYTVHTVLPEDINFERNETEQIKTSRVELFQTIASGEKQVDFNVGRG